MRAMLALALLATPASARAAEPPPSPSAARARSILIVLATERESEARGVIGAQLSDLPVELVVLREQDVAPGPEPAALVAAFRVSDGPDSLIVEQLDPSGHQPVDRREIDRSGQSLDFEIATTIIREATIGVLARPEPVAGPPPAKEPVAGPPPAKEPVAGPPPSPTPPPRRFGLGLHYEGGTFSDELRWQSGGGVWLAWAARFGLQLRAGYAVSPGATSAPGLARLTLVRHVPELGAGYRWSWPRLTVTAEAQGRVDVITWEPRFDDPALVDTAARRDWMFAVGALGRVGVRPLPSRGLTLFVSAGLDAVLNPIALVVAAPDREALVSPDRVRARLATGVAWWFR